MEGNEMHDFFISYVEKEIEKVQIFLKTELLCPVSSSSEHKEVQIMHDDYIKKLYDKLEKLKNYRIELLSLFKTE